VTTSVSQKISGEALWEIGTIDFVPAHLYDADFPAAVLKKYVAMRGLKKPMFIAEYGRGTSLGEADQDRLGRDLRGALWGTFMLPLGGNAMPWWWDSHIRPNNLERLFAPLARFAEGIDRRSHNLHLIETAILLENDREVAVRGLLNNSSCYLWLHRPADEQAAQAAGATLIARGQQIALSGMLGGKYAVAIMDTGTGRILRRSVLTSERGRLVVPLVRTEDDIAVKIEYQGDARPRFYTSPDLLKLEGEPPAGD